MNLISQHSLDGDYVVCLTENREVYLKLSNHKISCLLIHEQSLTIPKQDQMSYKVLKKETISATYLMSTI